MNDRRLCNCRSPHGSIYEHSSQNIHGSEGSHAIDTCKVMTHPPGGDTRCRTNDTLIALFQVMSQAGQYVQEDACRTLVVLISNTPELQGYAVRAMYRNLHAYQV